MAINLFMVKIYSHDTGEKPCDYIKGETARFTLYSCFPPSAEEYTSPSSDILPKNNTLIKQARESKLRLVKAGFFNQTGAVGAFHCPNCKKCFSAAVKLSEFEPSKSQRQVLRRNEDIDFSITEPFATRDGYDLFLNYINNRHPDSNMCHWNLEEFRSKVLTHSHVAVLKLNRKIIGMSLIDADDEIIVGDYCFYDVKLSKERSLGRLMDLKILDHAKKNGISFVSFGALNQESPKLRHKGSYAGTHIFFEQKWIPYQPTKP